MRVFVSYTTKDPVVTDDKLQKIEYVLKPIATVFIDKLHNKNGSQTRVNFELWRSDLVLNVHSPKYKSEWVQKELATARKRNKPIIKISIDELLRMDSDDIHALIMDVGKKQWSVWLIMALSLLSCMGICVLGIWLSYRFVSTQLDLRAETESILNARGVFGDSWGGVNAIISAFAFAGVIVTLFLQNRDLNLQRKEMARQREEFEKENETLKYQRFENLFYNMLNLQQKIVDSLILQYEDKELSTVPFSEGGQSQSFKEVIREVRGRDVFQFAFVSEEFRIRPESGQSIEVNGFGDVLAHRGLSAYDDYLFPTRFDHYFRHLYKIVQYIDNQGFPFDEAYKYVSFLRGTLSRYELVWIYYNALSQQNIKMKKLIEKYTLLKSLRRDILTVTMEAKKYYSTLGVSNDEIKKNGFTSRDFEFYLTDDSNDNTKYQLSAFWKKDDIQEGLAYYNAWRSFIDRKVGDRIEHV